MSFRIDFSSSRLASWSSRTRNLFLAALAVVFLSAVPVSAPRTPAVSHSVPTPLATPLPPERPIQPMVTSLGNTPDLTARVSAAYPELERLYKELHSHPELSQEESATAGRLAKELSGTNFEITHDFGGFGLVAVLRNGPGPTVLVRTEMDALPVTEQTGLPYASKVRGRNRDGCEVGVMHACGHDIHMTCWVGTARMLASMKDRWHGTLVFIAQPAEEIGAGAYAMLEQGLYTKFPKPDYCLALHCDPEHACGHVAFTEGLAMANVDMLDITVRGKGGHGALPHMAIDPVVLSARLILDLQTLVSRENNPTDPLVVTVGTIHGGTKANIIPDEVQLKLTVRTTRDATRQRILERIGHMARSIAEGAGAPAPVLNIHPGSFTPAVLNDDKLTDETITVFKKALGADHVHRRPPLMGGEDFALYGRKGVPSFLYFLGTQPPELLAEAGRDPEKEMPSLHSPRFCPVTEPTVKTGVTTMSLAVLNLLGH